MAPELDRLAAALGLPDDDDTEATVATGPDLAALARQLGPLFATYLHLGAGRLNRRALRAFLTSAEGARRGT